MSTFQSLIQWIPVASDTVACSFLK
jgi:hypothetical protein